MVEELAEPDAEGRRVRLIGDLQLDFALNQPLSPFALAAVELLDRESPTYPMDVVSIIESTLDDPRPVLYAQQSKARGEAVAAMKADGIEYEERMALLDDVTYPMPLAELLEGALETYRRGHPWVSDARLSPKSVARDMFERSMTFVEYISHYQLARSEGLVLRYLADTYRALRQTVPDEAKTEELADVVEWLGELVRQVDSSLLDEWEKLAAGADGVEALVRPPVDQGPAGVTANTRAFRVMVRNALFRRVELAALHRWDLLGELDAAAGWGAEAWRDGAGALLRAARGHRHRTRRTRAVDAHDRGAAGTARRPAGARRPGGRPGLGHHRGGRPGRLGRGGPRRGLGDGRGAARRLLS